MRYHRITAATCTIGLLLLAVAVGTAAVRSSARARPRPPSPPLVEPDPDLRALGREVFREECASCHPGGQAVGRAIPSLRGLVPERFLAPGGRAALLDLFLAGTNFQGREGAHPAYAFLSDEEVAAAANHLLTSWGNDALLPEGTALLAPGEVAARREALGR